MDQFLRFAIDKKLQHEKKMNQKLTEDDKDWLRDPKRLVPLVYEFVTGKTESLKPAYLLYEKKILDDD